MPTEEERKRIIDILNARATQLGRQLRCPMCGHENFSLTDGYFAPVVQLDLKSFKLGGTVVPSVSIICTNCGFISQHAMGTLGLLPPIDASQPKEGVTK